MEIDLKWKTSIKCAIFSIKLVQEMQHIATEKIRESGEKIATFTNQEAQIYKNSFLQCCGQPTKIRPSFRHDD